MKRVILSLILLLALMTALPAFAATGDVVLARTDDVTFNDSIRKIDVQGDMLYLMGDHLYTYKLGDAGLQKYAKEVDYSAFLEAGQSYTPDEMTVVDGDRIFSIVHLMEDGTKYTKIIKTLMYDLQLEDGKAIASNMREVQWPRELVDYQENNRFLQSFNNYFMVGGKLALFYYAEMGSKLCLLDLETMKLEDTNTNYNVNFICPYTEGRILLSEESYEPGFAVSFSVFNPADRSVTPLGRFESKSYVVLEGLACDTNTGACYVTCDGQVCPINPETGELGERVASTPGANYGGTAQLMTGGYYAYESSEATMVLNLNSDAQSTASLKVYDGIYYNGLTSAYFDFTNAHSDTSVMISRDYAEEQNLIGNMLNRESGVDVYLISMASPSFEALYNRSYLFEMDQSSKITDAISKMYPDLQADFTKDGKPVVMPLEASYYTLSLNEEALKKIGLTKADVPNNWSDFLDFLNELPQYLVGTDVKLYYEGMTQKDMQRTFFFELFMDYQNYANSAMEVPSYNTPLLRGLLEKLAKVDFAAFGFEANEEDAQAAAQVSAANPRSENNQLFEMGTGVTFGDYDGENQPLFLAMDADTPYVMPIRVNVALINPFSQNPALAMEFVETLADRMPQAMQYNFIPALDEPIRLDSYEEDFARLTAQREDAQKRLEQADATDKQAIEAEIAEIEAELASLDQNGWEVSPAQLEWFRANDDHITCTTSNWLQNDSSGEAFELIQQYLEGLMDVGQLLSAVDQKVQMAAMEGA